MKRNTKKGFTLTELIIVIVIIGILAAVLIPVLSSYIKKARMATEKEIVRNINMALKSDEVTIASGEKHKTMYDALQVAKSVGYDVAKINDTKYGNEILWDSKNDVFCYLNNGNIEYIPEYPGKEAAADVDYFRIAADYASTDKKYSVYLLGTDTISNVVDVTTGIDVGEHKVIGTITYTRIDTDPSQAVIIRTNGGELVIDDNSEGIIYHYGDASSLNIIQCHTSSYHENGDVEFVEVSKGRIVLENSSKVGYIHINKKEDVGSDGRQFDDIIIAKSENAKMPEFGRDEVEIDEDGTLVVALEKITSSSAANDVDYIWLTKQGIYEQVKVSSNKYISGSIWADESNSKETQEAAQQIANNINRNANGIINAQLKIGENETYEVALDDDRNFVLISNEEIIYSLIVVDGEPKIMIPNHEENSEDKYVELDNAELFGTIMSSIVNSNIVEESGIDSAKAKFISKGVCAYIEEITDSNLIQNFIIPWFDFTISFPDKQDVQIDLPSQTYVNNAFIFNAFETEDEAELFSEFVENILGITDDSQIGNLTLANIYSLLESSEYSDEQKETVSNLIEIRMNYLSWKADFVVSFDKPIKANTVGLAGYYPSYGGAVGFGVPIDMGANEEIRLMATAYSVWPYDVFSMSYLQICGWVQTFVCGAANFSQENTDTYITVTLRIYECDEIGEETDTYKDVATITRKLGVVQEDLSIND